MLYVIALLIAVLLGLLTLIGMVAALRLAVYAQLAVMKEIYEGELELVKGVDRIEDHLGIEETKGGEPW